MVEKKVEIHDDMVSDLRINGDGLNFSGTIEKDNSVLKSF